MNRFCSDKPIEETTVVVAMSGGVDSSVVAAMLHDEGYRVIGATMQLYDHGIALEKKGACCAGKDIYDAKKVAEKLGFPHYVLNYESVFKEEVMEEFADSYLQGETPIPCVKCNQSVKFRDMYKMAKDLGADALATGHYIQRIAGENGPELHKGLDPNKDQSYFLFATTKEQLEFIHFPLGGKTKDETRQLARKYDLDVAEKPDSQDICFVPNGSYAKVIERLRPNAYDPGEIVHIDGEVLGKHNGIINYTVGQRKGLGISWHEPLYVVGIDSDKNCVLVGPESALHETQVYVKDLNWLGDGTSPEGTEEITVKLRSTHTGVDAVITQISGKNALITLNSPSKAITPGQACVFYKQNRVLGGGWITKKTST